jgi:chorismate dehydratase
MTDPLRFGEIAFINALPLTLPEAALTDVPLVRMPMAPNKLNEAILQQRLDVSPVSSACYLRNQEALVMLEEVSISAQTQVDSVLMFLPRADFSWEASTTLAVTDQSETSVALMRYMLFRETGFRYEPSQMTLYPLGEGMGHLEAGLPLKFEDNVK